MMNHFTKSVLSFFLIFLAVISANAQHSLYIDTVKDGVKAASIVSVSLRTKGFNGIVGLEGSLTWDTATLAYNGITYGTECSIKLTASDVNVAANYLTFLWTDASLTPNTVSDTSILLTLSFIVKKDVIGNSTIALSNTPIPVQIVDSLIATPVALKSFSGFYNNGSIYLNWSSGKEVNLSKYILQRSTNGNDFVNIKSLNALNKQVESVYSYTDWGTGNLQSVYYRLLIINHDGKYSFSNIIVIKTVGEKVNSLITYPNPVHKIMSIEINAATSENASLKIINALGKLVYKESFRLNIGSNFFTMDASRFAAGNYFIVVDGVHTRTQQFIKL